MYAAVLSRKYLTTKAIPLLAALAVTLSVATELIVWSVMGGFLTMLVDEGRKTDGDLRITWEHVGFGHYEDLVERLEADPAIAHATPMIETLAILGMPDDRPVSVQLLGIEPASYAEATVYGDSLYWRPMEMDGEQPLVDDNGDPVPLGPRRRAADQAARRRGPPGARGVAARGADAAHARGRGGDGHGYRGD
ncbi:MAG: hypothetical protein AAFV77_08060, partial [Planctomycetota bacterium]